MKSSPDQHVTRPRVIAGAFALLAIALSVAGCASAPAVDSSLPRLTAFWPPPPAEPRIQFVRSFALSTDVAPINQSALDRAIFGDEAERSVNLQKPYGVAMRNGAIYVCDTRNNRVTVLDLVKKQTRLMGITGQNTLRTPVDIAIAEDGSIYVADKTVGIVVFDPRERAVGVLGIPKMQAIGVAVGGARNDRLYVCNMTTQNILILDRTNGAMLGAIGDVGDEDGQFRLPLGVTVDSQGNLHVVDLMRCRVQKFSPDGKFIAAVGDRSDTAGNFIRPKHIAVDREGLVYVVDAAFQNVQVFDSDYRLLTSFGGPGAHPGAMDLPAGICVIDQNIDLFKEHIHPDFDAKRLILVTNQFGRDKVAVYALGQLKAGKTRHDLAASLAPIDSDTLPPGEFNPMVDPDAQWLDDEEDFDDE